MTWDRITMTIPVEHAEAANDVMRIVDFDEGGGDTFGRIGLSPDGTPPATHYGYNAQAARQDFVDMLYAAKGGTLVPIDWEAYGLTEKRVKDLFQAMEVEVSSKDDWPWDALLERLGLMTVRTEEA